MVSIQKKWEKIYKKKHAILQTILLPYKKYVTEKRTHINKYSIF